MDNKLKHNLRICGLVLISDLKFFQKQIKDKLIDAVVWGSVTLIVIAYILPKMGLQNFGLFQASSVLISVMAFEIYNKLFLLTMQIEQRKHIFYLFTLPVPIYFIFLAKIVFYIINALFLSIAMIPICKIILLSQMPLDQIAWLKLLIALIASAFFFGCFLIFLKSFVSHTSKIGHIFARVLFPLWFFGGFQFNWKTLYGMNEYFGYLMLLNPYIYATESVRSAIFEPQKFLPFGFSVSILFIFGIMCAVIGYVRVKRQLDLA